VKWGTGKAARVAKGERRRRREGEKMRANLKSSSFLSRRPTCSKTQNRPFAIATRTIIILTKIRCWLRHPDVSANRRPPHQPPMFTACIAPAAWVALSFGPPIQPRPRLLRHSPATVGDRDPNLRRNRRLRPPQRDQGLEQVHQHHQFLRMCKTPSGPIRPLRLVER